MNNNVNGAAMAGVVNPGIDEARKEFAKASATLGKHLVTQIVQSENPTINAKIYYKALRRCMCNKIDVKANDFALMREFMGDSAGLGEIEEWEEEFLSDEPGYNSPNDNTRRKMTRSHKPKVTMKHLLNDLSTMCIKIGSPIAKAAAATVQASNNMIHVSIMEANKGKGRDFKAKKRDRDSIVAANAINWKGQYPVFNGKKTRYERSERS